MIRWFLMVSITTLLLLFLPLHFSPEKQSVQAPIQIQSLHWSLIVVSTTTLPLKFPYEDPSAVPPSQIQFNVIGDFTTLETCEYAGKWFKENLRRVYKCIHN
ncbi:MAG: hypothetical protein P4L79_10305 [Legionella sp.]|uniref:hypothetical protein n=1 Tax=Legionella sp. TaxID=459 RepID=UPI00284E27C8|nr:hypothetical protein [Legionella sp.]